MKKIITICAAAVAVANAMAGGDTLKVDQFRYYGPVSVYSPVNVDSVDVQGKKFEAVALPQISLSLDKVKEGALWSGKELPTADTTALHLLGFSVSTADYFVGKLNMDKDPKDVTVYLDGQKQSAGALTLIPGTHELILKYFSTSGKSDTLDISFSTDSAAMVPASSLKLADINATEGKMYTIEQLVKACSYSSCNLSADGKWMIVPVLQKNWGRDGEWVYYLIDRVKNTKTQLAGYASWMPSSNRYYFTRKVGADRQIVTVDPATRVEEVFAHFVPEGGFNIFPTEDRLLMTLRQDAPKELNPDAFEIIHPDDRQPGWRERSKLAIYDLKSGVMQPLTHGYNSHYNADIRFDGQKVLVYKTEDRLTARPTTLFSLYEIDVNTLAVDTLVSRDGFFHGGMYNADGTKVVCMGSPEAFNRVGCTLPDSVIPSMYDYQLYVIDVQSKEVTPITKNFNPSIVDYEWSYADGKIYFSAEDRDLVSLFRYDPKSAKIEKIEQPEEVISHFGLAKNVSVIGFSGESSNHSWRLYSLEMGKKGKLVQHDEVNAELYAGVNPDPCTPWTFKNSNGDEVCCRYYKPADFDESKQYPMIVYYYGGCSPTSRYFEYTYPAQIWSANGYAVLVVNPSGAAGFGQEWASRHVNTAGKDPARDIIEATKTFCAEHAWVNADRLGCIGASYGGFMTQYLQTKTDIFRCAVSHAGISDHSNYWGYGYWGYTYSEVSMANSYPWTRKDLYVDESPLYNVDKIKSSMLFLHGTADTNVPYNNSVQMYTALRLLGKDVAFVSIEGENHGIRDPKKRVLWHNATMAWFARNLKDDPTWWNALYPKKNL